MSSARRWLSLWLQAALTESGDDPEIRRGSCAGTCATCTFQWARCSGAARRRGRFAGDRDPRAEAWIFIAVGLLIAVTGRLGGLQQGDLERIRASRRAWLTGS